eukprot:sb/3473156/
MNPEERRQCYGYGTGMGLNKFSSAARQWDSWFLNRATLCICGYNLTRAMLLIMKARYFSTSWEMRRGGWLHGSLSEIEVAQRPRSISHTGFRSVIDFRWVKIDAKHDQSLKTWLQAPMLFSDNLRVLGESSWSCEYGKIPADSSRCERKRYLTFE